MVGGLDEVTDSQADVAYAAAAELVARLEVDQVKLRSLGSAKHLGSLNKLGEEYSAQARMVSSNNMQVERAVL